jgi:O-antigen/teichoic acid export membrane protein
MAGYLAQIVLITHMLGLEEYGVLALAVSFAALVSGFFDLQLGDTAITFATKDLDRDAPRAAGILQIAYIAELVTGVLAFGVVVALAPFVGPALAGDEGPVLFALLGLTLLAGTAETTSVAILRLFGRFGLILRIVLVREVLRVAGVATALLVFGTLTSVALALVALELVAGTLLVAAGGSTFSKRTDVSLRRPWLHRARDARRPMLQMMVHTNLITYAKLVQSQAPTLLLGALRAPLEVGAFKVGMAIASAVAKPADPAWAAVMPRLSRLRAQQRLAELRRMLKQATIGALLVIGLGALLVFALRDPLLTLVGGQQAAALGATVLVLGLLARGINAILFWNTPVIYSAQRAHAAAKSYLAATVVLAPVLVVFVHEWGANGAAGAILLFTIVLNVLLTRTALQLVTSASDEARPQ